MLLEHIEKLTHAHVSLQEIQEELKALIAQAEKNSELMTLLDGVFQELLSGDYPSRLKKHRKEVEPLAEHFVEKMSDEFAEKCVFFESGATVTWIAVALRKMQKALPSEVITNNIAVLDILCRSCRVWQTPGWAEAKYFSTTPFEPDTTEFERDYYYFQHLCSPLGRVNRLILDASAFHFLIGPTVNSRQHATFKAVAYNTRKPIDVLLPGAKIFTDLGSAHDADPRRETNTVHWHLKNCFTVFEVPFSKESQTLARLMPTEDSCELKGNGITQFKHHKHHRSDVSTTWLEILETNPDVRIWMALRKNGEFTRITEHLNHANEALQKSGRTVAWKPRGDPEEIGLNLWAVCYRAEK